MIAEELKGADAASWIARLQASRDSMRSHQQRIAGAGRSACGRARDGAHHAAPERRRSAHARHTVSIQRHARLDPPATAHALAAHRRGAARASATRRKRSGAPARSHRVRRPMITGFNHVSIVVPDLAAAIARLQSVYGLTVGEPKVNEAQGVRLAWVELPNAKLELMEPTRPDSPVATFSRTQPERRHPSLLPRRGRHGFDARRPRRVTKSKRSGAARTSAACTATGSRSCTRRIFSVRWSSSRRMTARPTELGLRGGERFGCFGRQDSLNERRP